MKKFLSISIIALLLASSFTACKKGENDPFSLRSRKARLTGEWELKNADYKNIFVYNGKMRTKIYSYNNGTMTITEAGESSSYTYAEVFKIEKDGTFTIDISQSMGNNINNAYVSGVWYFLKGNKKLGVKNREIVQFLMQKIKLIDFEGNVNEQGFEGKNSDFSFSFVLDRLSNKDFVVKLDNSYTSDDSQSKVTGTKTYEKVK